MAKSVRDSLTEQTYMIMPKHCNGYGKLFGGQLMQWIDEVAALVALRHAGNEVTTASVDTLNFTSSATVGDVVVLVGRLTYVGKSSMEVRVDTYVEKLNGARKMINHAYLVCVAVDELRNPTPVPRLDLNSDRELTEWASGERRHALRKERRKEGY